MVGQRDDWSFPEQSTSLCAILMGHKWMYQVVSAPLRRVRCIWGFRASRDRFKEARARPHTSSGQYIWTGTGFQVCCNQDCESQSRFLFKEVLSIQAEKERHLHCIRRVERLQPCCAQNNWFPGWTPQLSVHRFKLGWVWRAGEGRHLPVTCRLSPLTSHFRYTRPLRSVWSVPQRLGTFITHWLWTFISQAAGKEATDFRYENKTHSHGLFFLIM